MSIDISVKDIATLFYEQQRCHFLTRTAGLSLLVKKLRTKFKLSKLKSRRDWDIFFLSYDYKDSEFFKDFRNILALIQTNKYFLENALMGIYVDNIPSTDSSLPFHVGYEGESLGDGFFIKISQKTRRETVIKSYEEAIDMFDDMNKFEAYTGKKIVVSRRDKKIDLNKYLSIFLTTEKVILKTFKQRDLVTGKELDKLVVSAIESTSEEVWGKVNFKKAENMYYKFLEYYMIPRFSQFKSLLIK